MKILTIQQFSYAELYSSNNNNTNEMQNVNDELQHIDNQEDEVTSVNTMLAQSINNDNNATEN